MAQTPRPAATLILLRPSALGPEVLMLQRTQSAAFLGGAYVFPGGALDPQDSDRRLLKRVLGRTEDEANARLDVFEMLRLRRHDHISAAGLCQRLKIVGLDDVADVAANLAVDEPKLTIRLGAGI